MYNQVERACRKSSVILLAVSVILLQSPSAVADIHRAKTHTGKVSPYPSSQLRSNREKSVADGVDVGGDSGELEDGSKIAVDEGYEAWVFALLATTLVGMTGIFPLLLPMDVGPATNNKEGAAKFKCLLSFAVGGLLGDVFFHLLPEAWSHVPPDDHVGQVSIGLWVICGIFAFLVLEKMFGDDDEAEKQDAESVNPPGETPKAPDPEKYPLPNKSAPTPTPAQGNGHILPKNGSKSRKRRKTQENGHVRIKDTEANGWTASTKHALKHNNNHNGYIQAVDHQKVECKESKVKVTGYLNLLANFIDNFTHGLAVAGSFLVSKKCGVLTTAAILLHEVPHEIGDFAILLRSGFDRWRAAKAQVCTATGGLCGALLALMSESAEKAGDSAAWILPFTSGGFLNIALVTVLPDLLEETNPREAVKQILCLLFGIGIMGAVNLVVD